MPLKPSAAFPRTAIDGSPLEGVRALSSTGETSRAPRRARRRRGRGETPAVGALLVTLLLLGPAVGSGIRLSAQEVRTAGPVLLDLATSTRGLGLGGAFHPGGRDSDAVFVMPGLLNNPTGMSGAFQAWGRGGSLAQLSAGTDWWSGGVAMGVRALSYGTTTPGFGGLPVDEGDLRGRGKPDGAAELHVTAGYGRVLRGFRIGATGSFVQLQTGGDRDFSGAVSLGVARSAGVMVISASALNLGPDLSQGGTTLDLSRRFVISTGPSRALPVGPIDLNGTGYLSVLEDNSVAAGGGIEVSWWPIQGRTFTARAGLRDVPEDASMRVFTLGAGFQGDRLGLDYAVVPFESGVASHRIGLHFR